MIQNQLILLPHPAMYVSSRMWGTSQECKFSGLVLLYREIHFVLLTQYLFFCQLTQVIVWCMVKIWVLFCMSFSLLVQFGFTMPALCAVVHQLQALGSQPLLFIVKLAWLFYTTFCLKEIKQFCIWIVLTFKWIFLTLKTRFNFFLPTTFWCA
jgi:hypothetical protein